MRAHISTLLGRLSAIPGDSSVPAGPAAWQEAALLRVTFPALPRVPSATCASCKKAANEEIASN